MAFDESTIPHARAATFGLITELGLLDGGTPPEPVQVTFGYPVAYARRATISVLGLGGGGSIERAAVVNGRLRREEYTIELAIRLDDPKAKTDADAMALELLTFGLWKAVRRAVIVGDANLAGTVDTAFPDSTVSDLLTAPVESGGYRCQFLVRIACTAWLD